MKFSLLFSAASAACSQLSCLANTDVTALNDQLCSQMMGMPGCSLRNECKKTPEKAFCSESVIYATLCQDMPSMRPCQSFMSCSSAEKCDLLPTTETVTREIYSICTEMNMAGCENCKIGPNSTYAECDLMSTYSQLCTAMPNMSQCGEFKQMCMMNSDVAFCPSSSASPSFTAPVMQMFFHFSMSDYILFEQWVPRNTAQYTLAWFLVFLAASFYEALNVFSYFQELKWGNVQQHKHDAAVDSAFGPADKRVFSTEKWHGFSNICGLSGGSVGVQQAMLRAMLRMLSTFIGYSLMLIAMTFNVGLFIAIIVGFGVGTFCFVPMIKQSAIPALMGPVGNTECH